MTAVAQPQESAIAVLRNRKFLSLWIAQVVTQVGGNMVLFGLTVEVFAITGKSTSVSLLILSFLVPAVIFGAIAGVYVDRLDRRMILVVANAARGGLFLLLLIVPQEIWVICLITAFISTLSTFFGPAEIAMIPVVVPRRQLLPANSLHIVTLQASFFLGFALLGPLVLKISSQQVLLVLVAASYFLGALLCWTLQPQPAHRPRQPTRRPGRGRRSGQDDLRPARRWCPLHPQQPHRVLAADLPGPDRVPDWGPGRARSGLRHAGARPGGD